MVLDKKQPRTKGHLPADELQVGYRDVSLRWDVG